MSRLIILQLLLPNRRIKQINGIKRSVRLFSLNETSPSQLGNDCQETIVMGGMQMVWHSLLQFVRHFVRLITTFRQLICASKRNSLKERICLQCGKNKI